MVMCLPGNGIWYSVIKLQRQLILFMLRFCKSVVIFILEFQTELKYFFDKVRLCLDFELRKSLD